MLNLAGLRWSLAVGWVALTIAFAPTSARAADPVKVGPELNVSPDGYATVPRVASDPYGNFVVVWEDDSNSQVRAQRFHATGNPFGTVFTVGEPDQETFASGSTSTGEVGVAMDDAGNAMFTYTGFNTTSPNLCSDEACLFTRQQDANGKLGSAFVVRNPLTTYVYGYTGDDQVSNPEVSALANGEFVVVWESYDLFEIGSYVGSDEGVFSAKVTSKGSRKGPSFRVNSTGAYYQGQYGDFAVDGDAAGNFVVVFQDESGGYDDSMHMLRGQRFDASGDRQGDEFFVSSGSYSYGYQLDLAQAADGTFMVIWVDDGIQARIFEGDGTPVTDDMNLFVNSDSYPAVAASDDSFVVVTAGGGNGMKGKRFDLAGNALGGEFVITTSSFVDYPDVAAAANGNFVATWLNGVDSATAQRFEVAAADPPQDIGVFGKSLVLGNKVPDNPDKNKVSWKAKGPEIAVPPRGTASDPRCNGDPDGTVKASLRFFSDDSGHDSGSIDLPCQNWIALGSTKLSNFDARSFRYADSRLDDGPCKKVSIRGTKSLNALCKGGGPESGFDYDLEVGIDEVTVHAVLELGSFRYCASFPPDGSKNGSDGKTFKGKNAPIGACLP